MAEKRRPSPKDEDIQRIAENMEQLDTFGNIKDYDTFLEEYREYMEGTELENRSDIQEQTFEKIKQDYPNIYDNRQIRAKEEQLRQRKGVSRITMQKGVVSGIVTKKQYKYEYVAKSKKKIVYARQDKIIVRKKEQIVYRDRLGRYASVKRK